MKMIYAVIQPHKLDDVKAGLSAIGVQGLTVTEARGFGRQKGKTEIYRGSEYEISFVPKLKVEVVVPDDLAAETVRVLAENARTGRIGDGKVFVLPVESAMRIRTGETGDSAL